MNFMNNETLTDTTNKSKSNVDLQVTLQPNTLQLIDCMDFMRECPSNYFDLAIVDPPYGLERFKKNDGGNSKKIKSFGDKEKNWNNYKPDEAYFNELFRVSKNQIVWGGNNFNLPASEYFLIWDKKQSMPSFARCEYAWVSMGLKVPAKIIEYTIAMHNQEIKIHPSQKPVELYKQTLKKYAKSGDKILDTHVGSGSSLVACKELGFEYYGCEIDEEYFAKANERIARAYRKYELFE